MRKTTTIAVLAAFLMLVPLSLALDVSGEGPAGPAVLIDMGNGETYWTDADVTKTTVLEVISDALDRLGIEHHLSGGDFVVGGISSATIEDKNHAKDQASKKTSVTSTWTYYEWAGGAWYEKTLTSSTGYNGGDVALGFYPDGILPSETPDYRSAWTMVLGDSANSASQTSELDLERKASVTFAQSYGSGIYVDDSALVVGDKVLFTTSGGMGDGVPVLYAYDRFTFEELWHFAYPRGSYEVATGAVAGGYVFIPASNGHIYRINIEEGPGSVAEIGIPVSPDEGRTLVGNVYATGPASLIYDSGAIFFASTNGKVYALDPGFGKSDMAILWETEINGRVYYSNPTIHGDNLFVGALDGVLYAIDKTNGKIIASEEVFTRTTVNSKGEDYTTGSVGVPAVVDGTIYVSFNEGRGMNSVIGGIAAYTFDGKSFTRVAYNEIGLVGTYVLPVDTEQFKGVYFSGVKNSLSRMSPDGNIEALNDSFESAKAGLLLLNGDTIVYADYRTGGYIRLLDMDGQEVWKFQQPKEVANYCMAAPTLIDGAFYSGTDGGFYAIDGYALPIESDGSPNYVAIVSAIVLAAFVILLLYIKLVKKEPPMRYVRNRLNKIAGASDASRSKTRQNKRRLVLVLVAGAVLAFVMFLACLSFGPYGTISLGDALSAMISSIQKGGSNLTDVESAIYDSRLPRAIAAVGVGMGLAVAGSIYQAVIRNPLVDPYIMGVSSGAGTFAVAALTVNFTLFGLLDGSSYTTPILASVGGVAAFALTMLIAKKSGGSSTNYVLSGVVVGLAFSSIMTIMLVTAESTKLHGALTWLYGSFANIGWDTAWLVFFPAAFMSLIPLLWAKELNLVLLGEDQARQMGLNVRRFNTGILVLASVLTAVCVAFVGIIGFVGLVVPHICRMVLGGDHRLVLPASIVVGAAMMLFADLLARMVMIPQELPVGAITTMIGVPLFAYLLIKKGRMYDG
ncbi:MAG: iron chelate uptake ABC transporter family permease subunit [Candidatus Methanoplasma sp.]|nr:iron chelate uptake ABC transporter family permease subunit [Candidatus Methanoplasma sp.]